MSKPITQFISELKVTREEWDKLRVVLMTHRMAKLDRALTTKRFFGK